MYNSGCCIFCSCLGNAQNVLSDAAETIFPNAEIQRADKEKVQEMSFIPTGTFSFLHSVHLNVKPPESP